MFYSFLSESTGFERAAFKDWMLMVATEIAIQNIPLMINAQTGIAIWYAKPRSHLFAK